MDGRANAEAEPSSAGLVDFASSEARIVRGLSDRDKTVFVGGVAGVRGEISSRLP